MQLPSAWLGHHTATFDWRQRLRAAAVHLGLSALVALLAAVLVFFLWYPYPYRVISGGRELFQLVVGVDVVVGPLITFAIFDRAKPRTELRRDLVIVGILQLAALGYGLWTVEFARPVHLAFEIDRFRVVHRVDIPRELEARVPPGITFAPLTGPTLVAVRPFRDQQERFDATVAALKGVQLGARPDLWEPYDAARQRVLQAARPVSDLEKRFPQQKAQIEAALARGNHDAAHASYLPLVARKAQAWTVLLDASTADVIGYLPLDSF
jgi:hypothetical protein